MAKDDRKGITPSDTDNKLGLIDPAKINMKEAEGMFDAYKYAFGGAGNLDDLLNPSAVLKMHRIAFFKLYHWGGAYRRTTPIVRLLELPQPSVVPNMTAQLLDNTDFRRKLNLTEDEKVQLLAEFHHKFVAIHPFTNGNGRMARLLTDILAASLGYENIDLYAASGIKRQRYLDALEAADRDDYAPFVEMVRQVLTPL